MGTLGSKAEGVLATFPFVVPAGFTGGPSAAWVSSYMAQFGEPPGVHSAYGYMAAQTLIAALERVVIAAGDPLDREAVRAAAASTTDLATPFGQFSMDANGNTTLRTYSVLKVIGGSFVFDSTAN